MDKSEYENKRLSLSSRPGGQCQGKSEGKSHERKACIWVWFMLNFQSFGGQPEENEE